MYFCVTLILICITTCINGAPGDIAKEKCQEYAKYVYVDEYSPLLHVNVKLESISKCGIVEVPLIIGGVKASPNEFPHMAVIGFGSSGSNSALAWSCGGSLISDKFVMTAAHCMNHREKGMAQRVRLGTNNIEIHSYSMQEISISQRIIHPNYSSRSKYNDIGLMELSKMVRFNEHVRPACLSVDLNLDWTTSFAIGFGKLAYEHEHGSAELMKVQLQNIKMNDCHEAYKTFRSMTAGVHASQFCAGEMAGKKDTCQGDSGGPLQTILDKPYCMYNIIGITSFGKFCGFENSPGLYTRVAYFIEWIETNVWK